MKIGPAHAILGSAAAAVLLVAAAPIGFWFLTAAVDSYLGWKQVIPVPVSLILASAAALVGLFWILWAHSYLVFLGKGLPLEVFGRALRPTSVLVTTGPYAYTRNPIVLGFACLLLGTALLRGSGSGLVIAPLITAAIIAHYLGFEQKALERRFGADYEEYRANVPIFLPRLTAYVHTPVTAE